MKRMIVGHAQTASLERREPGASWCSSVPGGREPVPGGGRAGASPLSLATRSV
jgi:hypothetical protein